MKAICSVISTLLVFSVPLFLLFTAITGIVLPGSEIISRNVSHSEFSTMTSVVMTVGSFPIAWMIPWLIGTCGLCLLIFKSRYRSIILVYCVGAVCLGVLWMPIPLLLTAGLCVAGLIIYRHEFFGTKPPPLPKG